MKLSLYGNQPIITPRDPQLPMEAANKNYVDNSLLAHSQNLDLHLTASQNTWIDNIVATYTEVNYLSGVTSGIQAQLNSKLNLSGGSLTGALILASDPIDTLQAATKQYVDNQDGLKVAKAGDTMTGHLTLSGDPTSLLHATPKQYVDSSISTHASDVSLHLTSAQNTWLDAITVSSVEVNQLTGITANVQSQIDGKVTKSGDTMTGALMLHADPIASLQAATKQYVDNQDALKVAKAGDTMTGALVLAGDPTTGMQAATKRYVDTTVSTHASNETIHLTSAQNTWIDAITATSTEVNYLNGVTSSVQSQIDSKVNRSGDTMTGVLKLAADPVDVTDAATKRYVDNQDALKVAKVGDTMTGPLVLAADPTANLEATTKQYVDNKIDTHSADMSVHLTTAQNDWLDAIGITATEANYLSGVKSNVQAQIDTKFDKAGGLVSGDITLDTGKTIFVSKVPVAGTELVNKTYVDALVRGQEWKDPVTDINLIDDKLSTPPATPVKGDVYIVGTNATGAWLGKEGFATYWNDVEWVFLQDRPVAVGDRFGVSLTSNTAVNADLLSHDNKIVTISDATVGAIVYVDDTITAGSSVLVFDPQSSKFGVTYTFTDEGSWVATNTSVNITAGDGLSMNGNILNFNHGKGLTIADDIIEVKLDTNKGIQFDGAGALYVPTDGNTVTITAAGVKVSDGVMTDIADRLSKTATSTVSGNVTFNSTASLKVEYIPTLTDQVVNKGYVDTADNALQTQITNTKNIVEVLNTDPVTKTYVDTADATKVAKAGDTMTGHLTLNADPVSLLHAAPKQYVDNSLSTHAADMTLHLTTDQNAWLDAVTVTSTEVNRLDGVTANVQTQLNSKLALAGGTMTGDLTLNADPLSDLQAATKHYVDVQDALKVSKAGDTMTGALVLPGDPTAALQAAPKQYVDATVNTHASNDALHVSAAQNELLDALTVTATEINTLQGITSSVQSQIDGKVTKSGGTMTGALTLHADPIASLQAATKQYVDNQDALKVSKAGDTMTGALVLAGDPTTVMQAATKQYIDTNLASHASNDSLHITAEQNTLLDNLTATYTELNYLGGVTANVQTQLDSKLNLSGGTLTGALTLAADPAGNLQAATKQYVDNQDALKVSKAGDTMTGALVLHADPTVAMQAATKQFVDTSISTLTTYVDNQDATKVAKAGDAMSGHLTLNADPTVDLHAATKHYVDSNILSTVSYVDAQDVTLQGQISALQSTVTTLNTDPVTKTYVNAQDSTKVNKAGDTMTGYLTLHADPQQAMHAVTKQYVDAIAQGLATKPEVRLATTEALNVTYDNGSFGVNSTLTAINNGTLVVDGVTPIVGDRILVKNETTKAWNGDYVVQQVGDINTPFILKRVSTIDESSEVPGSFFYVYDGLSLKSTGWVLTVANPITFAIGTDDITVNQFSGQGSLIAGNGLTISGNTIDINTANPSRIVIDADSIDLAVTGVTPGTYTKVVVDGYGRVTTAANPTTLAGYSISDGQPLNANLTSLSNVSTTGLLARDVTNTIVTKAVSVSGVGLSITNADGANAGTIGIASNATENSVPSTLVSRDTNGNFSANMITANLTGNASTATTLATSRDFSVTGDVEATAVAFDGSANVTLTTALTQTGVVAGTYTQVTVDNKGRITTGTNPTTLSGYGITDAIARTEYEAKIAELEAKIAELHLYIVSRI